jgi:hypothetical protein
VTEATSRDNRQSGERTLVDKVMDGLFQWLMVE